MPASILHVIRFAIRCGLVVCSGFAIAGCQPEAVAPCGRDTTGVPICGADNPEDLAQFAGTSWILFPQGRNGVVRTPLALINSSTMLLKAPLIQYPMSRSDLSWGEPNCDTPPPLPTYRGIDVRREDDGTYRIAAINGSTRQRIELFTATADDAGVELKWVGCLIVPELWFLNDVAVGPDGQIFATHMFYRQTGLRQYYLMVKFLLGTQTGYAVHWTPDVGWQRVANSSGSFPNGIVVDRFGQTVYMASTYNSTISRISVADGTRKDALLSVRPDNITWAGDNKLIVAGGNGVRMLSTRGCGAMAVPGCGFEFGVTEIDPDLTTRRSLFLHLDHKIPGASVALQVGNNLFLGSAFADRITIVSP